MPLYFKELENVFIHWYKLYTIEKPRDCREAWVSYKSLQKNAKKKLLKDILKIFKNIEKKEFTVVPDLDKQNRFYIRVEKKLSKL